LILQLTYSGQSIETAANEASMFKTYAFGHYIGMHSSLYNTTKCALFTNTCVILGQGMNY